MYERYNEMVRVSSDPPPGIQLWMQVSWYELKLYKDSHSQVYRPPRIEMNCDDKAYFVFTGGLH
jgi:hypothetical protein